MDPMGITGNSHFVNILLYLSKFPYLPGWTGDATPKRYGAFVELVAALSCLMGFVLIGDLGWKNDMFSGLVVWIPGIPLWNHQFLLI